MDTVSITGAKVAAQPAVAKKPEPKKSGEAEKAAGVPSVPEITAEAPETPEPGSSKPARAVA